MIFERLNAMTQQLPPKNLVLYADDDIDDIDLIRDAFRHYPSVEIVDFENGEALLHYAQHLASVDVTPCLIILDVNMPRMDGKSTLRALRSMESYQHTPVILYTTSTLPDEKAFARKFNAGFVTKPLCVDQIRKAVDLFVDQCSEDVRRAIKKESKK